MGIEFFGNSEMDSYVFDEDGNEVHCPLCGGPMIFDSNNRYVCSECQTIMERGEFFDYIGVESLGPECLTCNSLYPGCEMCPYGYVVEENI